MLGEHGEDEFLGHMGNLIMPPHRSSLGVILLRAYVALVVNAPALESSAFNDLVAASVDCWHKMGHYHASNTHEIALNLSDKGHISKFEQLMDEAEEKWEGDFRFAKEMKSKYAKRKDKELLRKAKLSQVLKGIKKVLCVERERGDEKDSEYRPDINADID